MSAALTKVHKSPHCPVCQVFLRRRKVNSYTSVYSHRTWISLTGSCDRFRLLCRHLWHCLICTVTKTSIGENNKTEFNEKNPVRFRLVTFCFAIVEWAWPAHSEAAQQLTGHDQQHFCKQPRWNRKALWVIISSI